MRKLFAIATSLLFLSLASAVQGATTEKHPANTLPRHDAGPVIHAPPTAANARYKRIRAKAHRNAALARSRARALRLAEESR